MVTVFAWLTYAVMIYWLVVSISRTACMLERTKRTWNVIVMNEECIPF